jgi:hypothetical protein
MMNDEQINSSFIRSALIVSKVGLGRFELPTSPLSGVRSNQLSYRPAGLLPQNKGYKFSPVASVWFCSTLPAIELTKNKICNLSKLDRRKANGSNRKPLSESLRSLRFTE